MRSLALAALAHQDPDDFWLLLSGVGSDPSWRVRRSIAILLRTLDPRRSHALLIAMAEDPDARVRTEALRSLGAPRSEGLLGDLHPPPVGAGSVRARGGGGRPWRRRGRKARSRRSSRSARRARGPAPARRSSRGAGPNRPRSGGSHRAPGARGYELPAAEPRRRDPRAFFTGRHSGPAAIERARAPRLRGAPRSTLQPSGVSQDSRGSIEIELFIDDAPQTVSNFIRLSRRRFFDGLEFYQVIPNGYVASGDPRGDGSGGPNYTIRSEINERPFLRGTLAMVEEGKDTGGSRFLIAHMPDMSREGLTTIFGQVTTGMEVVDRLEPGDVIEQATIWDGVTSPSTSSQPRAAIPAPRRRPRRHATELAPGDSRRESRRPRRPPPPGSIAVVTGRRFPALRRYVEPLEIAGLPSWSRTAEPSSGGVSRVRSSAGGFLPVETAARSSISDAERMEPVVHDGPDAEGHLVLRTSARSLPSMSATSTSRIRSRSGFPSLRLRGAPVQIGFTGTVGEMRSFETALEIEL